MTKNALSGYTKFRNRKIPILWTGEKAEHVTANFLEAMQRGYFGTERILHLEIQKGMQNGIHIPGGRNTYYCLNPVSDGMIVAVWNSQAGFAVIHTGHKTKSTVDKFKKSKGIGQAKVPRIIVTVEDIPEVDKAEMEKYGISAENYAKGLTKVFNMKWKIKKE